MGLRDLRNPVTLKTWGHEICFQNNGLYCGKELVCVDGKWSSEGLYHYHPIKDETFYIISGILVLDIEGTRYMMHPGEWRRIKPYTKHRFRSAGDQCNFIEVSTPHSDDDCVRCELDDAIRR